MTLICPRVRNVLASELMEGNRDLGVIVYKFPEKVGKALSSGNTVVLLRGVGPAETTA